MSVSIFEIGENDFFETSRHYRIRTAWIVKELIRVKFIKRTIATLLWVIATFVSMAHASDVNLSRVFFEGSLVTNVTNSVSNKYEITSDGAIVIFTADFDQDSFFELYKVGIDGSQPKRIDHLSGSFINFKIENDDDFTVSPNGQYVVFNAKNQIDERKSLFAYSLVGNSNTMIEITSQSRLGNGFKLIGNGQISLDSRYILFNTLGPLAFTQGRLSGESKLVTVTLPSGDLSTLETSDYRDLVNLDFSLTPFFRTTISPSSDFVLFAAKETINTGVEVFSIPIGGGSPTKLSVESPSFGSDSLIEDISRDGRFVIYRRNIDGSILNTSNSYVTDINGNDTPVQINAPLTNQEFISGLRSPGVWTMSPNGSSLFYYRGADINNQGSCLSLCKATLIQTANPLSNQIPASANFSTPNSLIFDHAEYTTDSGSLFYTAASGNEGSPSSIDLFKNGLRLVPPNQTLAGKMRYVKKHFHSDDGQLAIISAGDSLFGGNDQIFRYDASADTPRFEQLSNFSNIGTFFTNGIQTTPDKKTVLLTLPDNAETNFLSGVGLEVLYIPVDGSNFNKVTPSLTPGGHILSYKITPDSQSIVYLADKDQDQLFELFVTKIAQSSTGVDSNLCFPIKNAKQTVSVVCL